MLHSFPDTWKAWVSLLKTSSTRTTQTTRCTGRVRAEERLIPAFHRRWSLPTSIIFPVIVNSLFAMRTVSCDFIFKEFNQFSAIFTFHIKNCISLPFLSIISSTFSQNSPLYDYLISLKHDYPSHKYECNLIKIEIQFYRR